MRAMAKRERPIWGQNIRRLVDANGETAKAVAKKAAMSEQHFSNLTNDPELNPTIDTLQRVSDALGVPLAELFVAAGAEKKGEPADGRRALSSVITAEDLTGPLRTALAAVLVDMLNGLAATSHAADESTPDPRVEETKDRDLSARHGRAIRG